MAAVYWQLGNAAFGGKTAKNNVLAFAEGVVSEGETVVLLKYLLLFCLIGLVVLMVVGVDC